MCLSSCQEEKDENSPSLTLAYLLQNDFITYYSKARLRKCLRPGWWCLSYCQTQLLENADIFCFTYHLNNNNNKFKHKYLLTNNKADKVTLCRTVEDFYKENTCHFPNYCASFLKNMGLVGNILVLQQSFIIVIPYMLRFHLHHTKSSKYLHVRLKGVHSILTTTTTTTTTTKQDKNTECIY